MIPELRPDLQALQGYHSPEVDADVRLNTNESPYPPPPELVEAIAGAVRDVEFHRYPDRGAVELRVELGAFCGTTPDAVFAAKGSNEVIQTLLLAFGGPERRALLFGPTYTMHTHIAEITGTRLVSVPRDSSYSVPEEVVAGALAGHDPDIVFFCHPNNPTGTPEVRDAVLTAAQKATRLVIVDEAYVEFADSDLLDLAVACENVAICRTMSKAWSMPAVRLGYVVAAPRLIAQLEAAHLPYHLDSIAQAAGRLALRFPDEMRQRVGKIIEERRRICVALEVQPAVALWPSQANFVLIRPEADADAVWAGLLARGVLVRNVSGWGGTENCLRVTVGTRQENDRFITALAETVSDRGVGPVS